MRVTTLHRDMYLLGLAAPDRDALESLRDTLAAGLADHGAVAVVEDGPADLDLPPGVDVSVRLDDAGWTATGTGASLDEALARLAPDHEYALVVGHPDADLPRVVVDGATAEGPVIHSVADPDAVPVDAVRAAVADEEPFVTLESLVAEAKRAPAADRAGAIATFTGRVRERDDPDDVPTTALEFEKYAGVAEERMAEIAAELEERDGVYRVLAHHRTGTVGAGEDIVFVVVLAGHRREAFRTVEDGIDRLKAEVPIFKKEVTVEESYWVHER